MNRRIFWLTVLTLGFPAGISAQSIHPFFRDEDAVFKPELVGRWDVQGVTLEFRDLGQKTYGILLKMDKDSAIYFRAHLFRVNERFFLDGQVTALDLHDSSSGVSEPNDSPQLAERDGEKFDADKSDFVLNRAHGLILVSFSPDPDEFFASVWEASWLPRMNEDDKLNISRTKDDLGRVLLTAETEELREWVKELPKEAFDKPEHLTREKVEDRLKPSAGTHDDSAMGEEAISGQKRVCLIPCGH